MIISRSPLRITFGGGSSDLPSYYLKYGGMCISAAIDQYVYTTLHETYFNDIFLRYSKIEHAKTVEDIEHPIIREALKLTGIAKTGLEITSLADQPSGTGLGSSGSFTVSLLKTIHKYKNQFISTQDLAEMACYIGIDLLREPTGKQDEYISACGGVTVFSFEKDGKVNIKPLNVSNDFILELQNNLVMYATGSSRSASKILKDQNDKTKSNDQSMIDNIHYTKELGYKSLEALEKEDLYTFALLMNEHWEHKKKRSVGMSNKNIDMWYNAGINNGAIGGKLIGAGGSGFIMFYTEDKKRLRETMKQFGLKEVPIKFDFEGTKIL